MSAAEGAVVWEVRRDMKLIAVVKAGTYRTRHCTGTCWVRVTQDSNKFGFISSP